MGHQLMVSAGCGHVASWSSGNPGMNPADLLISERPELGTRIARQAARWDLPCLPNLCSIYRTLLLFTCSHTVPTTRSTSTPPLAGVAASVWISPVDSCTVCELCRFSGRLRLECHASPVPKKDCLIELSEVTDSCQVSNSVR